MTTRHPDGGSIPALAALMLGACIALLALLSGCSSSEYDDIYIPPSPFPRYMRLTVILNVSDLSGNALGDATVWVDGSAQTEKTSWSFVTLGDGYPESWRGFKANWIKSGFTVVLYDYNHRVDVDVTISKPGFVTQATTFHINNDLPTEVYGRDTFIMDPSPRPLGADSEQPRRKAEPGEVIGWTGKAQRSSVEPAYRITAAIVG